MKTISFARLGQETKDGRLIALDAELNLPDVFPVRVFDGYDQTIAGYGERPRVVDGQLVADFTLKGIAAELIDAGTHTVAPDFTVADWEYFPGAVRGREISVLVKAELRAVTVISNDCAGWNS